MSSKDARKLDTSPAPATSGPRVTTDDEQRTPDDPKPSARASDAGGPDQGSRIVGTASPAPAGRVEGCNCESERKRLAELDDLPVEAHGSIHFSEWRRQPCPVHDRNQSKTPIQPAHPEVEGERERSNLGAVALLDAALSHVPGSWPYKVELRTALVQLLADHDALSERLAAAERLLSDAALTIETAVQQRQLVEDVTTDNARLSEGLREAEKRCEKLRANEQSAEADRRKQVEIAYECQARADSAEAQLAEAKAEQESSERHFTIALRAAQKAQDAAESRLKEVEGSRLAVLRREAERERDEVQDRLSRTTDALAAVQARLAELVEAVEQHKGKAGERCNPPRIGPLGEAMKSVDISDAWDRKLWAAVDALRAAADRAQERR